MSGAYYNEHDPFAAQWLRNLMAQGHIARGEVDERSIEDVHPNDLRGFTQCHFFAGIGVWSYALRRTGWPDSKPIWTGSCPCQPFSGAGKGAGFTDKRHLWPAFFHLITHLRPQRVVGEQVAGPDGLSWLDLVQTDLEAADYAPGAVPFPSAGVGAPQKRERLYWVADALGVGQWPGSCDSGSPGVRRPEPSDGGGFVCLADSSDGRWGVGGGEMGTGALRHPHGRGNASSELGGSAGQGLEGLQDRNGDVQRPGGAPSQRTGGQSIGLAASPGAYGGPVNGFWRAADWLLCRDPGRPRWRPVEPWSFPLAHGAPARVGRLRAYGNACNAEAAIKFLEAVGP